MKRCSKGIECNRCRNRRGGYSYRWQHAAWAGEYNRRRREGAAALSQTYGTSTGNLAALVRAMAAGRDAVAVPGLLQTPLREKADEEGDPDLTDVK